MSRVVGRGRYAGLVYPVRPGVPAVPAPRATYYVDYANGSPTGDGSSSSPVNSALALRAILAARTPAGFSRPQIPAGTTTVIALSSAPDTSDPWSVLLDVDLIEGAKLIFQGAPLAPILSGRLSTVSSFARTPTNGQVVVTDSAVPNYFPMVPSLFLDATADTVGWLYEPTGGTNAQGTVTPPHAPQTVGAISFPHAVIPNAGDSYQIVPLVSIYFGGGSVTRGFPQGSAFSNPGQTSVFVNRIHIASTSAREQQSFATDFSVGIVFQECLVDPIVTISGGQCFFFNCLQTNVQRALVTNFDFGTIWYGGGSYGTAFAFGGCLNVDGDFVFDVGCAHGLNASLRTRNGQDEMPGGGALQLGNVSYWRSGGGLPAIDLAPLTSCRMIADFDGLPGTLYGTVGAGNDVAHVSAMALLEYVSTAGAAFALDRVTFKLGGQPSAWAFNPASGRFCGNGDGAPAPLTVQNIDAPLNAPGFGGFAQDPTSGARIGRYVA